MTPLQEFIEYLEEYWEYYGDEYTWLEKEKEFAKKCFEAGTEYGMDVSYSIDWGEEDTVKPDFNNWYKQFEDEN